MELLVRRLSQMQAGDDEEVSSSRGLSSKIPSHSIVNSANLTMEKEKVMITIIKLNGGR